MRACSFAFFWATKPIFHARFEASMIEAFSPKAPMTLCTCLVPCVLVNVSIGVQVYTHAASPARCTRRSSEEKDRATRSETTANRLAEYINFIIASPTLPYGKPAERRSELQLVGREDPIGLLQDFFRRD